MSVSYYQSIENGSYHSNTKKKENLKIVDTHFIEYNIDKKNIYPIIEYTLSQTCGMKVYGYNKSEDNYWCKTMDKSICTFFVTICIESYGVNKSIVNIKQSIGTNYDTKMFVQKFNNTMKLYQETPFLRDYLDLEAKV
jgi:hypothetical protein